MSTREVTTNPAAAAQQLPVPPALPPTVPEIDTPIRWELIWPGHPHVDVWLQGNPAPDFVFDRHQVAQLLGFILTPEIAAGIPAQWSTTVADGDGHRLIELWSRDITVQVALNAPNEALGIEFAEWVEGHRRDLAHDFHGAVKDSLPTITAGYGHGHEVASIARKLSTKYGHLSREFVFSRMCALGWIEALPERAEQGRYHPTEQGLREHLVFVVPKTIRGRKGVYSQVLVTPTGFARLEADLLNVVDVDGLRGDAA